MGFSYALDSEGKSAMHGGFGLFYQRTVLTPLTPMVASGRYTSSFLANFPLNNIDPGPRSGRFPTDPMLVNGPTVNRALLDQLYPEGSLARNTGTVRFDNPDRDVPWTRAVQRGVHDAAWSVVRRRRGLHSLRIAKAVRAAGSESAAAGEPVGNRRRDPHESAGRQRR